MGAFSNLSDDEEEDDPKASTAASDTAKLDEVDMSVLSPPVSGL
jgi:hypothetical protein